MFSTTPHLPHGGGHRSFARTMGLTPYLSFAQRNLTPTMWGLTPFSGKAGHRAFAPASHDLIARRHSPKRRIKRGFSSGPSHPLAPREDRRIEANLDGPLKAPKNHEVTGNSDFFSRSEKAIFLEILRIGLMSLVSATKTASPDYSRIVCDSTQDTC